MVTWWNRVCRLLGLVRAYSLLILVEMSDVAGKWGREGLPVLRMLVSRCKHGHLKWPLSTLSSASVRPSKHL